MPTHEPNTHFKDRITINVSLWQHEMDAMNALVHWLDALEKYGGHGAIPGYSEFFMLYRSMRHEIDAKTKQEHPF